MKSRELRARVMAWAMVIVTTPGLIVNPAMAANLWWDRGGGDGNWSTVDNWSTVQAGGDNPAAVPGSGDTVYLNADTTGGQISSLNGNQAAYGITFRANTTTGITIANNTLTLGAGGLTIENGAAAHTINSAIALGAAQAWANNSANALTVGGTIANGGYTLTITGSGTTTISIDISGTGGGITKTGSGTWNATYAPGTDQGYSFTGSVVVEGGNVDTTSSQYVGTFKNASSVTIGGGAIAAQLKVNNRAGLFYATRKTVTLKTNGKLTMSNNNSVHLFDLTFEGGELASGTGRYSSYPSWQLNGDTTVTADTGVSTMSAHWMGFNQSYLPNSGDSDITFNVGANSTLNVTGVLENGFRGPTPSRSSRLGTG